MAAAASKLVRSAVMDLIMRSLWREQWRKYPPII
jgi:hypothetical protein